MTTTTATTVESVAGEAATVLNTVMSFEPTIAGLIGTFFPPVAVAQPFVVMAVPFISKALEAIAQQNGGDAFDAFIQLVQHLTPNQPNAAALSKTMSTNP